MQAVLMVRVMMYHMENGSILDLEIIVITVTVVTVHNICVSQLPAREYIRINFYYMYVSVSCLHVSTYVYAITTCMCLSAGCT